jgi:hypothetical protein
MPVAPPLGTLRASVALNISLGCMYREKETISEVEKTRVQPFAREEMSVSYCQHIDVNAKKLTKVSPASLGAIDTPQKNS